MPPSLLPLDDRVAVAGQLRPDDMTEIAAAGYVAVVNNRPDGEAMFGQPSVLLLDEPTSALDSETSRSLMSTLVTIKRKVGIVVVTHDPIVVQFADRTMTLDTDGELAV